jgi:hypothetical protein
LSNTLSIGAVTATLRQLLGKVADPLPLDPLVDPELADATCTARPPDKARSAEDANQINLFLYHTQPNAALRNAGMPGSRSGDATQSPLALNLYYLITAYGRNFDDILSHRLLGRAMSILHDASTLLPADIDKALPGNDLSHQLESVRITPQPLSLEEMSKLWSTFQAPYRVSAAYEVRVVLIDSQRQSKAALPVLSLGPDGRGNDSIAGLVSNIAELTGLTLPTAAQPSARPGDQLVFSGHDLDADQLDVLFDHRLTDITLNGPAITSATGTNITLQLPPGSNVWPAGAYSVAATITKANLERNTNVLTFTLAPTIINAPGPGPLQLDPDGNITLQIGISPPVWADQRVSLIVGDLEYPARALPPSPPTQSTLSFDVNGRGAGSYVLRVRVDGVDSFVVDYTKSPLVIDTNPMLQINLHQ